MSDKMERNSELYEYVTTTHILCIVISVSALILYKNSDFTRNYYYSFISLQFFVLLSLIAFLAIIMYNSKRILLSKKPGSLTLLDLVYTVISFLVVLSTMYLTGGSNRYIHEILILPIIITASSIGKTAGLIAATVSTVFLIAYNMVDGKDFLITESLESVLILVMTMYVVGWFIGGLRDIEAQHRKQLKTNLQNLKNEIVRRERAEEQLHKLSSALEQSPSIAVITDNSGNIEYVNKKFTGVTGYHPLEVIGRNMFEQQYGQSPEEYKQILDIVNSGKEWRGELLSKKKNGEYYCEYVSISLFRNVNGVVTHLLKMAEDITERKRMEMEMARLDRLNLIGEMAAGIGHEIRNPLTAVRGLLQLYSGREELANYRETFDLMIDELDRANNIISEYLSLAKNKVVELEERSLNAIIENIFPLITADAIITDKCVEKVLGDIPALYLDEKEVRQLVLNLVRNGLEAMPPGGNLTLKTFAQGNEVIMAVQDQGQGIAPEVLEKIGTPFFTTKENGTGLGLAVCYSIATRHNAGINVETGPTGTTFEVRFRVKH